jgi:hypothetical protein
MESQNYVAIYIFPVSKKQLQSQQSPSEVFSFKHMNSFILQFNSFAFSINIFLRNEWNYLAERVADKKMNID